MNTEPENYTVGDLLDLKKAQMLIVNQEYQRGAVWTQPQKKKLVDSVLRGYPIPLFYFHHIRHDKAKLRSERFEVIDGQQRIDALYEFHEGGFKLFDPIEDEEEARFPDFIKKAACPWGRCGFQDLAGTLKKQFLETPLRIVKIETHDPNEARDLFVRLQSGMPLNSQEKRDAWPGQFTDFVLRLGGKTGLARYPGHDFFHVVMRAKKGKDDRGKMRQLAAQIAMLLLTRRQTGAFRDINAAALDDFYYENLGFDAESDDANRLIKVLDKITALLRDQKRSKILGHEAIHLVLLVDTLLDDYTRAWEAKFADAFDAFRENLARAKTTRYDDVPNEYWLRYGEGTRSNTDRADVIQRRHEFFASKMREALQPALKDPQRIFGTLDRDLIYYRDRKQCAVCNTDVVWQEAEFHHVEQHSQGGRTVVDNGALVHKECHPKGAAKEAKFADAWRKRQATAAAAPTLADVVKEEKGLDKLAKIFMKAAPGTTFEEARQTIKEHLKNLRTRSGDDEEDEDDEENGEVA